MLELKNITKIYETEGFKQKALNKFSIKFRQCEFVSILGPSGSGKTTLLNIIGGLDQYTSGDLIINSVSTKEYNDRDWDTYRNHKVGFVFQSYNLIPHQSVLSNVELALTLSGVSKNERKKKAINALKKVGLIDHINKRPNQLSGGQMQRVAIARALVNDPDILLADEPTGALDSKTSTQILDLLSEVAKDRLVIMVTHNSELAYAYSNRIVELKDGEKIEDSNPFSKENEKEEIRKDKKTSMSFITALSLSLNNLMTKKGRTILTAFAGSIGIIGIALIMSLSNGIQKYINRVEEETLSSYPLIIQKNTLDIGSVIESMTASVDKKEYNDNKIHSVNIMGDMLSSMSKQAGKNDLKSLKEYFDNNNEIKDYVSDIKYSYDVTMNLYKDSDEIIKVNPTSVFDSLGMSMSGVSSVYNSYLSNYDVFEEMMDNSALNKRQYDLLKGKWPTKYNEVVLQVDKYNRISDYSLYSLGILSQADLKEKFTNMTLGKEIEFDETSYELDELIGLKFKLVLNTDYYKKQNGAWINMSDDESFMKKVIKNAEDIEIVGIIRPNDEAIVGNNQAGIVKYTHELTEHLINKINDSDIAKEQISNKETNIFTGTKFSDNKKFDIKDLSPSQLIQLQRMSELELANFMKNYTENMNSSYEENLIKLGIADLSNPDNISIYPKDFDSKEKITSIIDKFNENKDEDDKIKYTDIVGIMMKSVTNIVDIISKVLIAFVAISLVVSSIMIAIITYISVIERTKEIGILRAIGASKRDIRRVFNAETLIIGLCAGIFGILITLLLNIPINIIIKHLTNVSRISVLPIFGAIVLIIISIILTVIAGLIPSSMASKKDPVEALRTE
ncbi:MAG: ABC transporter ATP-binding protein/permease [Bacilli bacterium]|nr:ABC transporter ATP-binding protein/permease [Bacilli bacterium]